MSPLVQNKDKTKDKKIEAAIEKILKQLDLPTRSDIKQLNQRIDELTEDLNGKNEA